MSDENASRAPLRVLLQTTIPANNDDWDIERFSLLRSHLESLKEADGRQLCEVVARNREPDANGDDAVLRTLDRSDFAEIWLFAVDAGDGLSRNDCAGITRFHQRGGGILSARDHQDLGSSLCSLGGVGAAHFFHTRNPDPDRSRWAPDDTETPSISWPNYRSGRNGDYQNVKPVGAVHELLRGPGTASGTVERFPAHPHEGAVGVPAGEPNARVIATGTSQATGRPFNLIVAFESASDRNGNRLARAVAESSFHHFVDFNWDTDSGAPSFVRDVPGDDIKRDPAGLNDIKTYVRNLVLWLAPRTAR